MAIPPPAERFCPGGAESDSVRKRFAEADSVRRWHIRETISRPPWSPAANQREPPFPAGSRAATRRLPAESTNRPFERSDRDRSSDGRQESQSPIRSQRFRLDPNGDRASAERREGGEGSAAQEVPPHEQLFSKLERKRDSPDSPVRRSTTSERKQRNVHFEVDLVHPPERILPPPGRAALRPMVCRTMFRGPTPELYHGSRERMGPANATNRERSISSYEKRCTPIPRTLPTPEPRGRLIQITGPGNKIFDAFGGKQ
jgi:hypothetical protein